jgi:type I restriction enzyme S subunit
MTGIWPSDRLGDLVTVLTDYHANGSYKKLKENVTLLVVSDYAVMIRTTNFEKGDFSGDLRFINEHAYNFLHKSKVLPGDILMNKIANPGSVYRMPDLQRPVSLGMNLFLIRTNPEKLDQTFAFYFLKANEAYVKSFAAGAAAATITKKAVKDLEIVTPDLTVQRKIAGIVSDYDDLIENNRRRIQLLEQAARLLYREWFVCLRFPVHEHVKIIDGVPEWWEKKTLGELVEIKKGKNITKDTANEGDVPVVAGGLTPAYLHDTSNAMGPVITISASGANAGPVNIYHEDIWASDCSYISQESTDYLYYYFLFLKSKQKEISGLQRGAAQPHVYPKDLMRLTVIFPPNRVVRSFEETISNTFLLIKNLTKQNKLLAQARDLLLPRLMNEEIKV